MRILIVDDEPHIREGLQKQLPWDTVGVTQALAAASGPQALEIMAQSRPQLMLCDINMKGMDGLTLIEHVRERFPGTRVIVLTGFDDFEYARRALRLQVEDFLLKPVEEEELLSLVARLAREIERDGTPPPQDTPIARAYGIIDARLDDVSLTVASVAAALFVTPSHLSRLFRREASVGVNAYIVKRRMKEAKRLLRTTGMNIGEVARAVGYRDANYFSMAFKKETGISPGGWRKEAPEELGAPDEGNLR